MGGCEGEGGQVFLNDVFPSMISLFCYYDGLEGKTFIRRSSKEGLRWTITIRNIRHQPWHWHS